MNGLLLSTDAAAAGSATGSGIIIVLYIVIFGVFIQETTSFKLQWNHNQDAKANPFRTFTLV